MKRTFSLFLALLIVFQSIIAVGEEQIPALKSKKENQSFTLSTLTGEEKSGETFVGESGNGGSVFSFDGNESVSGAGGESFIQELYQGIDCEAERQEENAELQSSASEMEPASPSYFEVNKKKVFSYADEEVSVKATLSIPESLPKGIVFLVRPIREEERPEQYSAYTEALKEHKEKEISETEDLEEKSDSEEEQNAFSPKELRLYDIGFFLEEEKSGEYQEIEPNKGTVEIEFTLKQPLEGDGELQAAHLPIKEEKREDGISTLDILDVTKEDVEVEELLVKERKKRFGSKRESLEFSLDSFSPLAIWKGKMSGSDRIKAEVDFSLGELKGGFFGGSGYEAFTPTLSADGKEKKWELNGGSYSPLDLEKLRMSFGMKFKDWPRTCKKGDKIVFTFPEPFIAVGNDFSTANLPEIKDSYIDDIKTDENKLLWKTSFRNNAEGRAELEIELGKGIEDPDLDVDEALANIFLHFKMDHSKWNEESDGFSSEIELPKMKHILHFPRLPELISGVKKTAIPHLDRGKIEWKIEVGTESKGVRLNGLTVTDSFDETEQKLISAKWNSTSVLDIKNELVRTESGGRTHYSYTFPAASDSIIRAPQTLTFTTGLKRAVFEDPYPSHIQNTVRLKHEDPTKLDPDPLKTSSTAEQIVEKVILKKEGQQISGNRVKWKINFNKNNARVYKATVVDELSRGLTLDEVKGITIENLGDGIEEKVNLKASNPSGSFTQLEGGGAQTVSYEVENTASGSNIKIHFAEDFQQAYQISFETKVDESSPLVPVGGGSPKKGVKNTARVKVSYPLVEGEGPSEVPIPPSVTTVPFETAFLEKKTYGVNKKKALLSWVLETSTKGEDYEKAIIEDTIASDSNLHDLYIKYGNKEVFSGRKNALFFAAMQTETVRGEEDNQPMADIGVQYFPNAITDGGKLRIQIIRRHDSDEDLKLSNLHIDYQTKAEYYIGHNENHDYVNSATIKLYEHETDPDTHPLHEKTVSKVQSLQNKLLKKEVKSFYRDGDKRAFFHFKITANENQYDSLANVKLEDDLNGIFFYKEGDVIKPLDSRYFTITDGSDPDHPTGALIKGATETVVPPSEMTIDNTHHKVKVELGSSLKDVLELNIYAYLNEDGQELLFKKPITSVDDLESVEIFVKNKATLDSTTFPQSQVPPLTNTTVEVTKEGSGTAENLRNEILKKSGKQGEGDEANSIEWSVLINPMGAKLKDRVVLADVIPDGLHLDYSSVKLYKTTHKPGSTEIYENASDPGVVELPQSPETVITGWYKERLRNFIPDTLHPGEPDKLQTTLKITLPKDTTDTYLLKYTTVLRVNNRAELKETKNTVSVEAGKSSSSYIVKIEDFEFTSAGSRVRFNMKKADALSRNVVLSGARYGLFLASDKDKLTETATVEQLQGLAEDLQISNSKGNIRFMGKRNENYYVMEILPPKGYARDSTVYGPYSIKGSESGTKNIVPVIGETKKADIFIDVREQKGYKVGTVKVKKTFESANSDLPNPYRKGVSAGNRDGLKAEFKLSIYPEGVIDDKKAVQVKLKSGLTEGEYIYDGKVETEADKKNVSTTASALGIAGLQFSELPWGLYKLEETATADGYFVMKPSSSITFEVKKDKDTSGTGSPADILYTGVRDGDKIVLSNKPTIFQFQKKIDAADSLSGSKFRLYGKKGDFLGDTVKGAFLGNGISYGLTEDGEEAYIPITGEVLESTTGFSLEGVLKSGYEYKLIEENAPKGYQIGVKQGGIFRLKKDGSGLEFVGESGNEDGIFEIKLIGNVGTLVLKNSPTKFTFTEVDQYENTVLHSEFKLYEANSVGEKLSATALTTWTNTGSNTHELSKLHADAYYRLERTNQSVLYEKNHPTNDYYLFQISHDGKEMKEVAGISGKKNISGDIVKEGANKNKELKIKATRILAHASLIKQDREPKTVGGTDYAKLKGAKFKLYQVKDSGKYDKAKALDVHANKLKDSAVPDYDYTALDGRLETDDIFLAELTSDENGVISTKTLAAGLTHKTYSEAGNEEERKKENQKVSLRDGLALGVYYFVEETPPTGYTVEQETVAGVKKNKKYVFVITKDDLAGTGEKKTVKACSFKEKIGLENGNSPGASGDEVGIAKNSRIPGKLKILKVDDFDHSVKLNGAKFGLYKDNAATIPVEKAGTAVVGITGAGGNQGELIFDGLDWYQDYYIKELIEPHGYLLDLNDDGMPSVYGPFRFLAEKTEIQETRTNTVNGVQILHSAIDPLLSYSEEDKKKEHWENREKLGGQEFSISGVFNGTTTESTRAYTADSDGKKLISGEFLAGKVYTIKEGTNLPKSLRPMKELKFKINNKNQITILSPVDEQSIYKVSGNNLELARERTALQFSVRAEHQERTGKKETLPLYGMSYLISTDPDGLHPISAGTKLTVNGERVPAPTHWTSYKVDSFVNAGSIRAKKINGYRPYYEGDISVFGLEREKTYYLHATGFTEDQELRKNLELSPSQLGVYKITVASDSNITMTKEVSGVIEDFRSGAHPTFTYRLKTGAISFHTTDFETRKKDISGQKYALYVKKNWRLSELLKGETREDDSIEQASEYPERNARETLNYRGEEYLLQEIFENDSDGNLDIDKLTLSQGYLLLNITEEREYNNPKNEMAFRLVEEDDGTRRIRVLSYGRDARNSARPRYQTAFLKNEDLYIRRPNREEPLKIYRLMNKEGILGAGEELTQIPVLQWLLYPRESSGGIGSGLGGKRKGVIPGGGGSEIGPGIPILSGGEKGEPGDGTPTVPPIGIDKAGNPIRIDKAKLPPEIVKYIERYGVPKLYSKGEKKETLERIRKKGKQAGGYTKKELEARLAELLGENRELSKEDFEELKLIGEMLGAMRKGKMDIYGRVIPTGDNSHMPRNLILCILSAVLLGEYLRREKKRYRR